jgi:hypothetical protein
MCRNLSELPADLPAILPYPTHLGSALGCLCILLALQCSSTLQAAPQYPHLFINAQELDHLRLKLGTEPWRARLLQQVKHDADAGNPVAAAVVHALTKDRDYGAKVRLHLLQQAKEFVPGSPGAQYPWGA